MSEDANPLYAVFKDQVNERTVKLEIQSFSTIPDEFYRDLEMLLAAHLSKDVAKKLKFMQDIIDIMRYREREIVSVLGDVFVKSKMGNLNT